MEIAQHLLKADASVVVYDPAAMENAKAHLAGRVTFARSAAECAHASDVLAITTPWPEFNELSPSQLKAGGEGVTVIDCWRVLPSGKFRNAVEYLTLGVGGQAPNGTSNELALVRADGD